MQRETGSGPFLGTARPIIWWLLLSLPAHIHSLLTFFWEHVHSFWVLLQLKKIDPDLLQWNVSLWTCLPSNEIFVMRLVLLTVSSALGARPPLPNKGQFSAGLGQIREINNFTPHPLGAKILVDFNKMPTLYSFQQNHQKKTGKKAAVNHLLYP